MGKPRLIEYDGKVYSIHSLAKEVDIDYKVFLYRINSGWDIEKAVKTPVNIKIKRIGPQAKICRAVHWKECFTCKLPDCVRSGNRPLKGEKNSL